MTPQDVFRAQLLLLRDERGWSQARLAQQVVEQGGVMTQTTVTRLERGPRQVTLDELLSLAAALRVSPLRLLLPEDEDTTLALDGKRLTTRDVAAWWLGGWAGEPSPLLYGPSATPGALHGIIRSRIPNQLRILADYDEDGSAEQRLLLDAAAHAEWLIRKHIRRGGRGGKRQAKA